MTNKDNKTKRRATPKAMDHAFAAFQEESDRACAILAASYIDHLLGLAIERSLPHGADVADDLIFGSQAPVASFAARTLLARALGIIDEATRIELDVIRKIRNAFAHHIDFHTFTDGDSTRDLAQKLTRGRAFASQYSEKAQNDLNHPRYLFQTAACDLIAELKVAAGLETTKPEFVLMSKPRS